jgi:SAM-dependent methyltransferase
MSAEQISRQCRTKPELTERLLIACTAMGLLKKHQDQYENTEMAETFLVRQNRLYQGDIIAHSATVWDFWTSLEDQIRLEPGPKDNKAAEHRDFIMGMDNIALAGRAQIFVDNIDLAGRKRLFDVGGGPGTYSIFACKRYPQLTAVVFDLPETIEITKEVIVREKMPDRITVQPGDWAKDSFGQDNDVVMFSNVLHGPASDAQMKFKKAYDAMVPGGLLVVQEFLLNNEKTGPLIPALFNVMVGAYSQAELSSEIETAGFAKPTMAAESQELGAAWMTAKKP